MDSGSLAPERSDLEEGSPQSGSFSPEDQIAAEMAATLAGAIHKGEKEKALGIYLGLIGHQEGVESADVLGAVSDLVISLMLSKPPKKSGVSLAATEEDEPLEDAIDLAYSDGPAGQNGYARELLFRSRFAVNSAKRLYRAQVQGGDKALEAQVGRERAYFQAHKRAALHREDHLALIDEAAMRFGNTLSWRAVLDGSTTGECRAAHGKNFDVLNPPAIGLPGMVHAMCRCSVGPPIPGAPTIS